jgi:hypothetical protein
LAASEPKVALAPRYNSGLSRKPFLILCALVSVLYAGLLFYSQTWAVAWDEGFHLLAAQLIKNGKRP